MDNLPIDLNLLRVFDAMIRHGNVTRAAEHVGLSQPATSAAIGRLREHFGDPLFVKGRSGMLPTSRALQLAEPIGEALNLIRGAMSGREVFDPASAKRQFRVYMTDVGEAVFLPPMLKRMQSEGPRLTLTTAQPAADQLPSALESGDFDLAIGYLPRLEEPVRRTRLFQERYVCMTRKGHALGRDQPLTLEDYVAAQHVLVDPLGGGHQAVEQTLLGLGLQNRIALRVPHYVAISLIVANSDLLVTIPSAMAQVCSELIKVKVHDLPINIPQFEVSIFWHRRFDADPGLRWLRETVLELFSADNTCIQTAGPVRHSKTR